MAANTMSGFDGDDTMIGGFGGDILEGGLGDDTLRGQRGADTLQGGGETDILIGESKNDVFDFNSASHSTQGARHSYGLATGRSRSSTPAPSRATASTSVTSMRIPALGATNVHLHLRGQWRRPFCRVVDDGLTIVRGNTTAGGGFDSRWRSRMASPSLPGITCCRTSFELLRSMASTSTRPIRPAFDAVGRHPRQSTVWRQRCR